MMHSLFRSNKKPQRASHLRYYLIHLMYKYGLPFDTYVDVGVCNDAEIYEYCNLFQNVIGFEPNPYANIALAENLNIHQVALSNKKNTRTFHIDKTTPHFSTLNRVKMDNYIPSGHDWETIEIATQKLDDFNLTPNCIKIDTEGEDDAVISGAIKTIEKHKPILYLEFMNEETLIHLKDIGYQVEYSSWIDNYLIHEDML